MHRIHYSLGVTSLGLAALLALGCDNSTAPVTPTAGTLLISVSTIAENTNVDRDGYTLSIDGGPAQAVGHTAMLSIGSLPWGRHHVQLEGVAENCSVSETNSRYFDVSQDKAYPVISFVVTCSGEGDGGGWWD